MINDVEASPVRLTPSYFGGMVVYLHSGPVGHSADQVNFWAQQRNIPMHECVAVLGPYGSIQAQQLLQNRPNTFYPLDNFAWPGNQYGVRLI